LILINKYIEMHGQQNIKITDHKFYIRQILERKRKYNTADL